MTIPLLMRWSVVEEFLTSFNFPERQRIDALWAKEAEQRLEALAAGRIKAKSARKVFVRKILE